MSSEQDYQPADAMNAPPNIDPQAHYATGSEVAPDIDLGSFSPEQYQAYQQAYTQAMQAQQIYAQAQQWYEQAQQAGLVDQQEQAYTQAMQAQQIYTHAHQTYLAILEQVQANAFYGQEAPPEVAYQAEMGMEQQMAYAPQPPEVADYAHYPQPQPMDQGSPEHHAQAAHIQAQAMQLAHGGAVPAAGYYQAEVGQVAQGAMQQAYSQDPAMAYAYGVQPQAYGVQPQMYAHGGSPQPAHQSDRFAQVGNQVVNSSELDGWVSLDEINLKPSRSGIWWWLIGILALGGGLVAIIMIDYTPPTRFLPPDMSGTKEPTPEELARQRRALLGEDREVSSRYLRELPITRKSKWRSVALSGSRECRSLYLTDENGIYVAEGAVDPRAAYYLNRTHPDQPFNPTPLAKLPPSIINNYFAFGAQGLYLILRNHLAGQQWVFLYPLVGNPLLSEELKPSKKRKAKKAAQDDSDAPSCGDSQISTRLLSNYLVMLGTGECSQMVATLGLKPALCLSQMPVNKAASITYWHNGRTKFPIRGSLQLDYQQIHIGKNARIQNNSTLGTFLANSPPPTPIPDLGHWVSVRRQSGQIWTLDQQTKIRELPLRIPLEHHPSTALRVQMRKDMLRVVYPTHLMKYKIEKDQLSAIQTFKFGRNITVTQATWDQSGDILLLLTKTHNIYQFLENP